jgi:hypothetical protein
LEAAGRQHTVVYSQHLEAAGRQQGVSHHPVTCIHERGPVQALAGSRLYHCLGLDAPLAAEERFLGWDVRGWVLGGFVWHSGGVLQGHLVLPINL